MAVVCVESKKRITRLRETRSRMCPEKLMSKGFNEPRHTLAMRSSETFAFQGLIRRGDHSVSNPIEYAVRVVRRRIIADGMIRHEHNRKRKSEKERGSERKRGNTGEGKEEVKERRRDTVVRRKVGM